MRVGMFSARQNAHLPARNWTLALVGESVDDRGLAARTYVQERSERVEQVSYDPISHNLRVGSSVAAADAVFDLLGRATGPIVLETTTLGFVETFLLCRALLVADDQRHKITLAYTEPEEYTRPGRGVVLQRRDFELSDEVGLFSGIPGAVVHLTPGRKVRAVFLVGYEGQRLAQALEQTELKPSRCRIVFGVPAFEPGWEMNSFANNVRVMTERHLPKDVLYAAADNPLSAYSAIERVHLACGEDEALIVSPIGTKPHGIGAALYAAYHNGVGLLYDHPRRKPGRSQKIGTWHLFEPAAV